MAECRLRVKIGPYELEAEGPQAFVEKHYGSFSERIPQNTQLTTLPAAPLSTPSETVSESQFAPIFHQDAKGISLTVKPSGDAAELDAVLVLLLGHKELRGIDLVSADELLYGLRQSGYLVERADRIVARGESQGLVHGSGVRRGTRYRITNLGIARAKAVAQELLNQVP